MEEGIYTTKIITSSLQAYDKINHFLWQLSYGGDLRRKDVVFYYLDKKHEMVAKLNNEEKTIELTDKVESRFINRINHILKLESVI